MNMRSKVKGITLIGFAIGLCVLVFFAYLAMRLIPMYAEYMGVVKTMEMERKEPGAAQKSLEEIRRDMSLKFTTQADDISWSPALHVNQVGYAPTWPKKAMVGYFLGSLGEAALSPAPAGPGAEFTLIETGTAKEVFRGRVTQRRDKGFR